MLKTLSILTVALLTVAAVFMFGPGCSRDGSVSPQNSDLSDDPTAIVATKPVVEPPTFVETFNNYSNVGAWSFFGDPDNQVEIIELTGGNPGAFMHATCSGLACLDTYAPWLRTKIDEPSIFTGNYRERKVSEVGVDIAIFGPEYVTTGDRPLSLMLRNDNGTPDNSSDDIVVYWLGRQGLPMPNGKFREYDISVPSQMPTLPKGWGVLSGWGTGDDDADWNTVINDVSQLGFHFGDPEMYFMFQQWDIGVDNPRIWFEE